ncbi:MAG: gluconeogenesis factor YvcK family protein [bacterium]
MKFFAYTKFPKTATFLLPGIRLKRWFLMIFIGAAFLATGAAIFLQLTPIHFVMEAIQKLAEHTPSHVTGLAFLFFGMVFFYFGWRKTNSTILDAFLRREKGQVLETLYRKRMLDKGPKIVVVGGGTGLSTILRGLKTITNNLTAIVTVGDDGGSSGKLRKEMGVLPPGDIRNCIAALADEEDLVTQLFQYRFGEGGLDGHSFGNLFLTALCSITGDMFRAIKESSKVLAIRGKVLPSTLDDMTLIAEMEDGRIIEGESNIPKANGKIKRLYSNPENPRALEDAIKAIKQADLIILGPGSLYTSVIPNLLIREISESIASSKASRVYICNIMTQPGETDDYSVSSHVEAVIRHAGNKKIMDAVIVNRKLPANLAKKYQTANSFPVVLDEDKVNELGIRVIEATLIDQNEQGFVRHSHKKLAKVIFNIHNKSLEAKQKTEV